MNQKVNFLKEQLATAFPEMNIEYRFEFGKELHKFKLGGKVPHWLYIAREFVDDHAEQELLIALTSNHIIKIFQNTSESKWLFLSKHGVQEVDGVFGQQHP